MKVTYSPICKEMKSSCNSSCNPNVLYSIYERGGKVLIRKAAGQRFLIIGYEFSLNICSWKMLLTSEAVPTQCSLEVRKGLGFSCRFRTGHTREQSPI